MRKELCCSDISSGVRHIMFGTLLQGILLILFHFCFSILSLYFSVYLVHILCYCCSCTPRITVLVMSSYPFASWNFSFFQQCTLATKNEVLCYYFHDTGFNYSNCLTTSVRAGIDDTSIPFGPVEGLLLQLEFPQLNFILHVFILLICWLVLWFNFLYANII